MLDFLTAFFSAHGGPSLFLISLVSATILPLSSEGALVGGMALGMEPWEALVWASAGNCLGVLLNYGIGRAFSDRAHRKLSESRSGRRALEWIDRYGVRCLLLSWTPFLGDPLTYAAGAFRIPLLAFILITFSLRVARYIVFVLFFV